MNIQLKPSFMPRLTRSLFLYAVPVLFFLPAKAQIDSSLYSAIKSRSLPAVQQAVMHCRNINAADSNGATALMWAVYHCELPVLKYLVEKGATVKDSGVICYEKEKTKFYGDLTSLAAGKGKLQIMQYLVDSLHQSPNEKGYDPFRRKKVGWTPVMWAVHNGQTRVVDYLLQKGIPVDETDEQGNTPLIMSAEKERWDIFYLLMNKRGKEKLGNKASDFMKEPVTLAKQGTAKGDKKKELAVKQFILRLSKAWFGEEHPAYANSLDGLAELLLKMNRYEKVLPYHEQANEIRRKALGEEHPDYVSRLNNLTYLYWSMGQYEKALPLLEKEIAIRKKTLGKEHPDYALSLNNLAVLYQNMGLYEKSMPYHEQAIGIYKNALGDEHPDYASSLNNLAALYKEMGQYEKALPLLDQAIVIFKKVIGGEHPHYALCLSNLALSYQDMGQYEKALPLLVQAKAIMKKVLGEEHSNYAKSLNNLALLYQKMGQYEKALPLLVQTKAIMKKALGEEHSNYAISLNNLANLYKDMGQQEKALTILEQAKAIDKKALREEHPYYAIRLNNLAGLYESMGQYKKALPLYQQSLIIQRKILGEEHPDYVLSLYALAGLFQGMGQQEKALSLFTDVSASALKYLTRTCGTLSEQEKLILLNKEASSFNYLPSLLYTQQMNAPLALQQAYANELALKGMVLEDQKELLNGIRKGNDSTALLLYDQWSFLRKSIGRQLLLPTAKRVPYLDSLQERATQLEQDLSRRSAAFRCRQQRRSLTAKDIVQKLSKDQAAIEFIRFPVYHKQQTDSTIYAALLLLPGDTIVHFIPLFEEKQLQRLVSPLPSNTDVAVQKQYRGLEVGNNETGVWNDSLYYLIWKPLEQHLRGIKSICYAPVGLLHRVAFQALRADSAHLLIDKYRLHQLLSTRSMAFPGQVNNHPVTAGIWGHMQYNFPITARANASGKQNVDTTASSFNFYTADTKKTRSGGKTWSPLPGTMQEMDSLKQVFQSGNVNITIQSGLAATEEQFKALDGKSPQLLHIATHGFFLPVKENKPKNKTIASRQENHFTVQQNPMLRSGLVLAGANYAWKGGPAIEGREDGILTAYEIAQMDLSNTDLVVLSACETALGDVQGNEGVIGLQRAFKLSGVKQMIVSLWRVPDRETAELMTLFYRHWLSGQSTREALRSAQMKMKEKHDPYYWAAFVLVE